KTLLLLRLARRAWPIGKDDRVAEEVVAELLEAGAQSLFQFAVHLVELHQLFRRLEREAQRRLTDLRHERRIGQVGGVDAQVLHYEAESHVVGNEAQQFIARRSGLEWGSRRQKQGGPENRWGKRAKVRLHARTRGLWDET